MRPSKATDRNKDFSPSVDRIDPTKGYVRGNVRVISYLANRMKSNATVDQLVRFSAWVMEDIYGCQGRVDAGQSAGTDTDQHADKPLARSYSWSH